MYKYETHLHTSPVSECARAEVDEVMNFYKEQGYDGIFITNHFIDGNINLEKRSLPYDELIEFYFSDYEKAKSLEKEIGIKVFFGVEMSYKGTDFLVYGLDKKWFLEHPEITEMSKRQELDYLIKNGALVVHAHPFREASYIDHIRLFPRSVQGVEVINANRTDFENQMAAEYAENYNFLTIAGSDNHIGKAQKKLAGISTDTPIADELDFIDRVRRGALEIFFVSLE